MWETAVVFDLTIAHVSGLPARIHMWTHNRLELIGTDAQLFCRFSGFPQPTVMWLGPDDTPITNGDRFHILENGDLTIKSLVWEDMGTYTCVVENQNGIDKTSTFLYPTLVSFRNDGLK